MAKRIRIAPGIRLDAVRISDDLTITKSWTEVSSTVARKLVGSTYKGRSKFEIEDDAADEAPSEPEPEAADSDGE